jgi:hypothetical protein
MKKSNAIFSTIVLATILFGITSCKKDKDNPETPQPIVNEEEIITTCKIVFTDISGNLSDTIAIYRDTDGDGGNGPVQFDTIFLKASTEYTTEIILLNETVSPADSISNEVREEGHEHLFCFDVVGAEVSIIRTDSDGTFDIGLLSMWTTTNASEGSVTVTLKHQPGVKDGTCEPGDTDIEIAFPVVIEN